VAILHYKDLYEAVTCIGEESTIVRIGTRVREMDGGAARALEILRSIVGSYAVWTEGEGGR